MSFQSRIVLALAVLLCIIPLAFLLLSQDKNDSNLKEPASLAVTAEFEEGKKLSEKFCAGCHTYPSPELLAKQVWREQTLPHMGPQLGIFNHEGKRYPVERTPNLPDNYYPAEQQLSSEEWQKIIDYYLAAAPEQLKREEDYPAIITDSLFFRARSSEFRDQTPPMVSSVRFDPGNRLIYLSDASYSMFYVFDEHLQFKDRYRLSTAISDIRFINDADAPGRRELLTTYIGDVNPSDALSGFVQPVWFDPEEEQGGAGEKLIDYLARPVKSQFVDLNMDGKDDLLVNEFGHRTGGVFWINNIEDLHTPVKKDLIKTPGCVESHVMDYTGNGYPDIFTLCTQLDQSIYLFRNLGDGKFERERLIQFGVTAGSSSFELYDFNRDGHLDIIYTSGDNADYSMSYKPYHGVYIYVNDGNNHFTKEWFHPMDGAYKTAVRDFDRDGYPDIAAISFFANYEERPEESFIFFKGKGDLNFTPYHHPAASTGRWITMDVADWDGDGYEDIILGNFSRGPTRVADHIQNEWMQGPHFLLLENRAADNR